MTKRWLTSALAALALSLSTFALATPPNAGPGPFWPLLSCEHGTLNAVRVGQVVVKIPIWKHGRPMTCRGRAIFWRGHRVSARVASHYAFIALERFRLETK